LTSVLKSILHFRPTHDRGALTEAIAAAGSTAALARVVGTTPQAVSQRRRVPAARVIAVDIRIQALTGARRDGTLERMTALVDRCMAEYDEHGWVGDTWLGPEE
jgi:methylase of polypeptide subunit release factors